MPNQQAPSCGREPTPLLTGTSLLTSSTRTTNRSARTEPLKDRDLLTFYHFMLVLDNQQRIIGHLMKAQETAESHQTMKTSTTSTNPHRSLWLIGEAKSTMSTTP